MKMKVNLVAIHYDTDYRDGGWTYFTKACANNLHVVLSMSPGDELRERCRNFPGLVNKTYINWIFPWPDQALHAVSQSFIDNVSGYYKINYLCN